MYLWYALLFHRPQIFICKSSNKSGLFSRSVGTPERKLFAEILLFLNLLFARSFLKIPERADVVKNFPEEKRKIGKTGLKHPVFLEDFFNLTRAWIGQKFLMGNANKSTISGLFPPVFGFLIVTEILDSDSKFKSTHVQLEDGSNEF